MSHFEKLLKDANEKQKDFYKQNSKTFFNRSQKHDCAQFVADHMDLQKMIEYTAVIIPNTNIIYYNYLLFKTYATADCSNFLIEHVFTLVNKVLETYKTFEFHINLKSFTISACHRYYPYIISFCDKNDNYSKQIRKIVVYNTPNIINQIHTILYSSVREYIDKVEYVYKDSDLRIKSLFQEDITKYI